MCAGNVTVLVGVTGGVAGAVGATQQKGQEDLMIHWYRWSSSDLFPEGSWFLLWLGYRLICRRNAMIRSWCDST
jgi:hypothetical protein